MSSLVENIKGQHLAAVLHDKGSALSVEHRQTPAPGPAELLVEVRSVALNPIDWKQRASGFHIAGYPTVLGSDVAGIVLSAGPAVPADAPKPGSRIAAFASAFFTEGDPNYGALQTRVIVPAANAVPLPEEMSFDEGALLPMAVATAWSGWYSIGIPRDTSYTPADKKAFLVWGGASSVGGGAVQLAASMGFSVYATASEKHNEYLKTLGAKRLFDYRDENVVGAIVKAARADGVHLQLAFDAVGALQSCQEILKELNPNGSAKLASATPLLPDSPKMDGVETNFVLAPTDGEELTEFFHFVFGVWLKEKLATGEYVPSPRIKVIEGGLESTNKALDELQGGVSGTKLVLHI